VSRIAGRQTASQVAEIPADATQARLLSAFMALVFYLILLCFSLADSLAIDVPVKLRTNIYLGPGVPVRGVGLFIAATCVLFGTLIARARIPKALFVCTCVAGFYVVIGLANGNDLVQVRTDFQNYLWLVGGYGLAFPWLRTKSPLLHLAIAATGMSILMHLAAVTAVDIRESPELLAGGRFYDPLGFYYSSALIVPTSLLLIGGGAARASYGVWGICLFLVHLYDAAFVTQTRSTTGVVLMMLAMCAFSTAALKRLGPSGIRSRRRRLVFAVLVLVGTVAVLLNSREFFVRIGSDAASSSVSLRFDELLDALDQLQPAEWVVGGGIGRTVDSVFSPRTLALHIGAGTLIMKFGLPLALAILVALLIRLPTVYFTALRELRSGNGASLRATAVVVSAPGIIAWVLLFCVSGGYSEYAALGLGVSAGVYAAVSRGGLAVLTGRKVVERGQSPRHSTRRP